MALRTGTALIPLVASLWLMAGCMTTDALNARVGQIKQKHNVTIRADNPLSRCYLFGYLPGLLNRMDSDLDKCPKYFKDNMGLVLIEETFLDNPSTYPLSPLIRGYVDLDEEEKRFPIHIRNRSLLEKLLFGLPGDGELFLHEATHSFEANVSVRNTLYWREFKARFDNAQSRSHGGVVAMLGFMLLPPLRYVRPQGMASFYGWMNRDEDVAETHCYLRRHDNNVEFLRKRDKALYDKCRILDQFVSGKDFAAAGREGD